MKKNILKEILNRFEVYLGTFFFIAMLILLTVQVVSRYVFNHSFVWTEEVAVICFVWMQYLGIVASVLDRKQLRIDFFIDYMPFKVKRVFLIIGNLFTMLFCGLIIKPMITVIQILIRGNAATLLTQIPMSVVYAIMPFCMVLMIIRLVQETFILTKESEKELGAAKPTLDLSIYEQEYLDSLKKEGNN